MQSLFVSVLLLLVIALYSTVLRLLLKHAIAY